jgi:hypothetical protein
VQSPKSFQSVQDAYRLLQDLGAPPRLIHHVTLVGEAADLLIAQFTALGLSFDADRIRLGVAFHDVGKILYPAELTEPGKQHEPAGEALLLAHHVDPNIARCCRSHGQWAEMTCEFEEWVVALADNLWKGKRNIALEHQVITAIATQLNSPYWDLFVDLDNGFEAIAAGGASRLLRSVEPASLSPED